MRKQPTGELCAGDSLARFEGRGGASYPYGYLAYNCQRVKSKMFRLPINRLRTVQCRIRAFVTTLLTGVKFKVVGTNCKILGSNILVGENVCIGDFCWIEAVNRYKIEKTSQIFSPLIRLGNNVAMSDFVHISAVMNVDIHDGVLIGSKVYIGDHSHGSSKIDKWQKIREIPPRSRPLDDIAPISIGQNCWIGDNVVILAGAKIGRNCIIAANSVVKGQYEDDKIIGGIPSAVLKDLMK